MVEPTGSAFDLSDRESHCIHQEEWLKKLKDPRPVNEAEGQSTGASRTKLLENGRDSDTSATKESGADGDLETSGFTSV